MIYIEYLILAALVVILSIFISKYVDELDKKTNMSGAFIGGVLLAAVTSLPEFITSLTAIFSLNQPGLIQGNVFGSDIFNLTVLGACILIFSKKFKTSYLSQSHILTSIIAIAMFIICFFGMKYSYTLNIGIFNINIASIIIIILYIVNVLKMNNEGESETAISDYSLSDLTVKQILIRFIICTVLLVVFSVLLTNVTDKLNDELNLGTTIGGAIFLGIATSLPEVTASFNLVKLGNFNAAFGNIMGSNLFNLLIIAVSDIFYTKGNILSPDRQSNNLISWSIISTLLVICSIYTRKNKMLSLIISILIIGCYVASISFSV